MSDSQLEVLNRPMTKMEIKEQIYAVMSNINNVRGYSEQQISQLRVGLYALAEVAGK